MRNFVIFVFFLYLCQNATAYCCFRDPFMLPTTPCTNMCGNSCANTCGSSSTNTCGSSSTNTCGNSCANSCGSSSTNTCGNSCNCGGSCKCFRDPANICNVCDTPSPVCQCMSKCGCDGLKCPIYFPEVEYPVTILEIDPFFYRTCFSA